MADGRRNSQNLEFWKSGIDNLKALGAGFAAFCGAECLTDFQNLPEVVGYTESQGIHTTIISSGIVADFKRKLEILHKAGAKSLTMSYDMIALDQHSALKSSKAIRGLQFFQRLGRVRDVAIIVTLTRNNFMSLPFTIHQMSEMGIWTFFDLIHHDRGQPGSKVRTVDLDLSFRPTDFSALDEVLEEVEEMKNAGFLCHSSKKYLSMLKENDHQLIRNYDWHCAKEPDFPAWVTVDCDGRVYCCDDYQDRKGEKNFYLNELHERFEEFSEYWGVKSLFECTGCVWSHHIDAHGVKSGSLKLSDYVHGVKC
jgi:hypothetical protein